MDSVFTSKRHTVSIRSENHPADNQKQEKPDGAVEFVAALAI